MTLSIIFAVIIITAILFVIIGYASRDTSNSEMNARIQKRIEELNNEAKSNNLKGNKKSTINKSKNAINDHLYELDLKIAEQERQYYQFQVEFDNIAFKMQQAKSLEKTNINHAILLYEECLNTKAGNFCPEDRLIILYRKIKDFRSEKLMCQRMIEKIEKQNYKRLESALKNDPHKKSDIKRAWHSFTTYTGSDGVIRRCSTSYEKYENRISQLDSEIY